MSKATKKPVKPKTPLPPDIIKALIASESSFNLDPKKTRGIAAGLTQITPDTHRYLKGEDGELKDFWIICTKKELLNPIVNICCGVRWMFRKRSTLRDRIKRDVSWIEVVSEYKSLNDKKVTKEDKERVEAVFLEHYNNTKKAK